MYYLIQFILLKFLDGEVCYKQRSTYFYSPNQHFQIWYLLMTLIKKKINDFDRKPESTISTFPLILYIFLTCKKS